MCLALTYIKVIKSLIWRRVEAKIIVFLIESGFLLKMLTAHIVAWNLRRLLADKGWTQDDFATRVGLTPGRISQLCKGTKGIPGDETFDIFCRVLNCEVSEFFKKPTSDEMKAIKALEDLGFEAPSKLVKKTQKKK